MLSILRNNKVAPVATFFVLVIHLIHLPTNSNWEWTDIVGIDKLAHFILFAGLTTVWLFFPWRQPPTNFYLFLGLTTYAVVLEIIQTYLTVYRSGELLDLLFDTGAVFLVLRLRKRIIPQ